MTDKPAAAAAPPPTADPQDPLPESSWFWRRLFVGAATAALMFGVWWHIDTVGKAALAGSVPAVEGLIDLLKMCLYLVGLLILLYLIAPSAEQLGKWMATVSAWKGGVSTSSTARSTSPDGSKAEATTTAGPAAPGANRTAASPATPATPATAAGGEQLPDYAS
jgi:hypothetical protein